MTPQRDPSELLLLRRGQPPARLIWTELFGNSRPIELEVGSGKGLFLAESAGRRPDHNFVGVELSLKYARKAAERVAKRGVENVLIVCDDARRMLEECVDQESVAVLHVYFPDPWWKKRHRKRRVFSREFVASAAKVLMPRGELRLATDVEEYFQLMTSLVETSDHFVAIDASVFDPPDGVNLTSFERKYRVEGRSIFRAAYRRMELSAVQDLGGSAS